MSTPEDQQPPAPSEQAPPPSVVVDDADDLRGHHLRALAGKTSTRALVAGLTIAAGVAFAVFAGPLVGAIAAAIVLALSVIVVFFMADSRAADAFFQVYADQRGLELGGRTSLGSATPLLRKGDRRYAERTLRGQLAPEVEGTLALFTYEEETRDSKGNTQTSYYRYTLCLSQVPDCAQLVPELYCQRKFGFRALEKFEDVFRGSKDRVKLESEALDDRYEIFANEKQDQNWLRQLFTPTFIVWLTDSAPDKFAFELVDGTLCCYVNGHHESAAELDEMIAASAAVVRRLNEESRE